MRRLTLIITVFLFSVFCARLVSAQTSSETLEQRIERLKAIEAKKALNETTEDRVLRLRAEQIRIERELKKAREDVKRTATPEMRQAMSEAEKSQKSERRQQEALERAEISGCDVGTIWVHPDAVPQRSISSTVRIRVFNPEPVSVNIEDSRHGVVVLGLCPGGSMTLFRARSLFDPDYLQFRFTALAMLGGRMATAESQSYTLSSYDWSSGGGRQEDEWKIQLRFLQTIR